MEKNKKYVDTKWELKTTVSGQTFDRFDFTRTDFNSGVFNNVSFSDCLFDKSKLGGSKIFYESNFQRCDFMNVDLSHSTFGSHRGIYEDCTFNKCDFKGKEFNFTRFINCTFDRCKLKRINFNASSFSECRFTGPMDDITFNGIYDTNKSKHPTLFKVDFSNAKFGEFVTFIDCDLSTSIPPNGSDFNDILYILYKSKSSTVSTGSKDRIVLD